VQHVSYLGNHTVALKILLMRIHSYCLMCSEYSELLAIVLVGETNIHLSRVRIKDDHDRAD
jgi:hypothetical protein